MAQLQPGHLGTVLRHGANVGKVVRRREVFAQAGAAGQVHLVGHNVVVGELASLEQGGVAGSPVQFAQSHQVGHHFVGLAVGRLVDLVDLVERGHDLRPMRLVVGLDDVTSQVEIPRFAGGLIQQHDRLQHTGCGHADVLTGTDDISLAFTRAEGGRQQIADFFRRLKSRLVAEGLVHTEQTDQVVLVGPDVPAGPALIAGVGAQVAVRGLAGNEGGRGLLDPRPQGRIVRVLPGEAGSVQPFADVFATPALGLAGILEGSQALVETDGGQAVLPVGLDALPNQPVSCT